MRWTEQNIPEFIPAPENGFICNWDDLFDIFPILKQLHTVPQDPVYHREGDVLTHTRMVVECLTADPDWRKLPAVDRAELWLGTLLHDIGKLTTTETHPDGRITSANHTLAGARMSRELLFTHPVLNIPFRSRENIAGYVRYHGLPVWFLSKVHPVSNVLLASQQISLYLLYLLSRNDMKGRICDDLDEKLQAVELFRDFCEEQHCLTASYPFADSNTRYLFALGGDRDPSYPAYDQTKIEVILLSGLPAAGKDTWIEQHGDGREVISLDTIRRETGIDATDNQGGVIQAAKEQARACLRAGKPFIWNATNITRYLRTPLIHLFTQYNASVRLVYLECPYMELLQRNSSRPAPVPDSVIQKLIRKMEIPEPHEAHKVEYVITGCDQQSPS